MPFDRALAAADLDGDTTLEIHDTLTRSLELGVDQVVLRSTSGEVIDAAEGDRKVLPSGPSRPTLIVRRLDGAHLAFLTHASVDLDALDVVARKVSQLLQRRGWW